MWFGSRMTNLLRGLPTLSHLNWVLISSNLHVLALMRDEPCGFTEGKPCGFSHPGFSILPVPDLIQSVPANFHHPPLILSKSLVSHPSCPCCMSLIFSQAQVSRATYVMGNMKGLTFNW